VRPLHAACPSSVGLRSLADDDKLCRHRPRAVRCTGREGPFGIRVNGSIDGGETSINDEFRHNQTTAGSLDWRDQGRSTLMSVGSSTITPETRANRSKAS